MNLIYYDLYQATRLEKFVTGMSHSIFVRFLLAVSAKRNRQKDETKNLHFHCADTRKMTRLLFIYMCKFVIIY